MGFLSSVFGGENVLLTVFVALAAVLVLIILGVWALKLVFNATGRASRGRAKRLGIVDITPIDQKRTLVLVRRDTVEHLLLIGGAQDLVIESRIVPEPAVQRPLRQMQPAPQPQPMAPPPFVAPIAPVVAPAPARPHATNLPPDLAATRTRSMAGRGSLRHTALVRPPERQEPDFIPSPPQRRSSVPADSDRQAHVEPVSTEAEPGAPEPDNRGEPNLEPQGTVPRPDETREGN